MRSRSARFRFCRQPGGGLHELFPGHLPERQREVGTVIQDRIFLRPMRYGYKRRVEQRVSLCLMPSKPRQQFPANALVIAVEQPLRPFDNRRSPPYLNGIVHGLLGGREREKVSPAFRMPWVVARRLAACQAMPHFFEDAARTMLVRGYRGGS